MILPTVDLCVLIFVRDGRRRLMGLYAADDVLDMT